MDNQQPGPTTIAAGMKAAHRGLDALLAQPLIETMWRRRTHRVSRGANVAAGSMTYTSPNLPTPLTELEEAILVATTGATGLTMHDRPFEDQRTGRLIMAKPSLNTFGRSAGSPDNAQGTHFFLINDTGTYFLRKLPPPSILRNCAWRLPIRLT